MRDNIKEMMDREVALRRSAQTRLADALESSHEGVVVVDARGPHRAGQRAGRRLPVAAAGAARSRARRSPNSRPPCAIRFSPIALLSRRNGEAAAPRLATRRRALAAHQPQRDTRRRLHRRVQRHHAVEAAGGDAAAEQPAARRCARQHVAGPVPVRCAEPARGRQPPLLRDLRPVARPRSCPASASARFSN